MPNSFFLTPKLMQLINLTHKPFKLNDVFHESYYDMGNPPRPFYSGPSWIDVEVDGKVTNVYVEPSVIAFHPPAVEGTIYVCSRETAEAAVRAGRTDVFCLRWSKTPPEDSNNTLILPKP